MILDYKNFVLRELNISGSYLMRPEEVDAKVKDLIETIAKKLDIKLPIESWSVDFISIKKELVAEIKKDDIIKFELNKKQIEELLLKYCSNKDIQRRVSTKKINITHLDFKLTNNDGKTETYQVIFPDDVKKYIIDNYSTNKLDYLIYINCEINNFNRLHFPGRIERYYNSHGKKFGKDEMPQPHKGRNGEWISDLFDGLPKSLRGSGIGYTIYKEFIKFKGYLSSNSWSSSLSQSVWKKLSQDNDLFGIIIKHEDSEGNMILFSKSYKGDYKKVCDEFIRNARETYDVVSIEIDEDLKRNLNCS